MFDALHTKSLSCVTHDTTVGRKLQGEKFIGSDVRLNNGATKSD